MLQKGLALIPVLLLGACTTTSTIKTKIPSHQVCEIAVNSRSVESLKADFGDVEISEVIGSPVFFVAGSPYSDFGVMSEEEIRRRVQINKELDLDPFTAMPKHLANYSNESLKRDIMRDLNNLPKRNSVPEFIIRIPKSAKMVSVPEKTSEATVYRTGTSEQVATTEEFISVKNRKEVVENCQKKIQGTIVQLKYVDKTEEMCLPKNDASKLFGCS